MKTHLTAPEPQPHHQGRNPLAGFLKVALVLLVIAVIVQAPRVLSRADFLWRSDSQLTPTGVRPKARDSFAFRKARMLADVRTFACVVRYLLEPEPRIQTNLVASSQGPADLASVPPSASRLPRNSVPPTVPAGRSTTSPAHS
jgi:hypothetical protein